jgi:hypothetical protein
MTNIDSPEKLTITGFLAADGDRFCTRTEAAEIMGGVNFHMIIADGNTYVLFDGDKTVLTMYDEIGFDFLPFTDYGFTNLTKTGVGANFIDGKFLPYEVYEYPEEDETFRFYIEKDSVYAIQHYDGGDRIVLKISNVKGTVSDEYFTVPEDYTSTN